MSDDATDYMIQLYLFSTRYIKTDAELRWDRGGFDIQANSRSRVSEWNWETGPCIKCIAGYPAC